MGCHRKQASVETKNDRKEGRKEKMSGRQAGRRLGGLGTLEIKTAINLKSIRHEILLTCFFSLQFFSGLPNGT
jgi:hypothetical protein